MQSKVMKLSSYEQGNNSMNGCQQQKMMRDNNSMCGNMFNCNTNQKKNSIFDCGQHVHTFNAVSDNPFRQFNTIAQKSQHQPSRPRLMDIINQLILPCCNNSFIITSQNKLSKLSIPYTMPCGHTICRQCINSALCTNLSNQNNSTNYSLIKCWHEQCGQSYSFQQAEMMFVENGLVVGWVRNMLGFAIQENSQSVGMMINTKDKRNNILKGSKSANNLFQPIVHYSRQQQQQQDQQQTIKKSSPLLHFSKQNQNNINNNLNTQQPITQTLSSSQHSSQTLTYNPCVNIFCRKPTISFYCSQQCDALIEKLQAIRFELTRPW